MKTLKPFVGIIALMVATIFFAVRIYAADGNTAVPSWVSWENVVLVITGIYEILSRVIPTSKTWSLVGNLIKALSFLSNLFDRKK